MEKWSRRAGIRTNMISSSGDVPNQTLKFAAVNLTAAPGEKEKNLSRMAGWVERLSQMGAEVVGFPELSVCGYDSGQSIAPYLEPVPGPSTEVLTTVAAKYNVLVLAGLARCDRLENRYIAQVAVSPHGVEAIYHKIYLSPNEAQFFSPGQCAEVFSYHGWKIGMQLCYDTHFPELSTAQALRGADVLFMGFATPHETADEKCARFMRYLPARAYDNSCYVVNCCLSGTGKREQNFSGGALAFDPKGNLIAHACDEEESFLLVTLERNALQHIRSRPKAHFLSHHKTILFGGINDGKNQESA